MQQMQAPTPVFTRTAADRRAHLMRELVETLLFVGLIFLIVQFAIKPYRIVGLTMQPQLQPDQLVVVNRTAFLFAGPSRGDVVVYDNPNPAQKGQQLIGRVIAIPGDRIAIGPNQVILNGVPLQETYVDSTSGANQSPVIMAETKMGKDDYFIMNDNRLAVDSATQHVQDSRTLGDVPRNNIVGKAVVVFWPLKNFGGISNFSSVFANVH